MSSQDKVKEVLRKSHLLAEGNLLLLSCKMPNISIFCRIHDVINSSKRRDVLVFNCHLCQVRDSNFAFSQKDRAEATSQWMLLRPDIMT